MKIYIAGKITGLDAAQFEHFKKLLNGKTETAAFAAAVEQVMLHGVN